MAQGMPKEVEDLLAKCSSKFVWDSRGNNSFNTVGNVQNRTPCFFNPVLPSPETLDETLDDGFRIFSASNPPCATPASQTETHQRPPQELVKITITGTHNVNKDGDHKSGGCIWFGPRDTRNWTVKIPEELTAPGAGDTGALLTAITMLPPMPPYN
ncbi:hypothetical protein P692DRAFT_20869000 [Suillus brevipes Sb2]|nr:hypothetical protein P692DRAFT_20869000 [Suillus brevipes Sb2]